MFFVSCVAMCDVHRLFCGRRRGKADAQCAVIILCDETMEENVPERCDAQRSQGGVVTRVDWPVSNLPRLQQFLLSDKQAQNTQSEIAQWGLLGSDIMVIFGPLH